MTKFVAIANQKGGVGKTTTTINLSMGLRQAGRKVLLVDLDPQGNATTGSGIEKREIGAGVYEVLLGTVALNDAVMKVDSTGLDVLPANQELAGAEIELVDVIGREARLKSALAECSGYDYVLLDCPPALSLLTVNGLVAAQTVIIPMQCEYYALEGLSDLVNTIKRIRSNLNPDLEIAGLLRTMFDARNSLTTQVSDQLKAHFGDKVYKTIIPRNVRLAEAPSFGLPIMMFDKTSKGALAYEALTEEFLEKFEGTKVMEDGNG